MTSSRRHWRARVTSTSRGTSPPRTRAAAAAVRSRDIAEQEGVLTSLTLSDPGMVEAFRGELAQMLGNGVHQLFCNEEEALCWTGSDRVDIAASELADIAPFLFLTLGSAGSLVVSPTGRRQVPGFEVDPVDTTGAGDIYAGACLHALCHEGSPADAARFANYAAARLVAQAGPRLPGPGQLPRLARRLPGLSARHRLDRDTGISAWAFRVRPATLARRRVSAGVTTQA